MRKTKFLWLALALTMLCYNQGSADARTTTEENNSPQTAGASLPTTQNVDAREMAAVGESATTTATKGRCAFFFSDPDGFVIIRKTPSTNAPEVKRLKESDGTLIFISPSENKNWYHVSKELTGPYLGYLYWNRAFLDGELAESMCECIVTDPDGYTNIRLGATPQSKIVGTMPKGKHFYGIPADDSKQWMGVLEEAHNTVNSFDFRLIGFVHTSKIIYRCSGDGEEKYHH